MVSLRNLLAVITLAIPVIAQTNPAQVVVQNFELITEKTRELQATVKSIDLNDAPLIKIGKGPVIVIIDSIKDITITATSTADRIKHMSVIATRTLADDIYDGFYDLIHVNRELFSIIVDQAKKAGTSFISVQFSDGLYDLEEAFNNIALALLKSIEFRTTDILDLVDSYKLDLDAAVEALKGLPISKRVPTSRVGHAIVAAA